MAAKRNAKGQFEKGTSGNPNGRPGIPSVLKEYARTSPERLKKIAQDENTPLKLKVDIEKWMFEIVYGKAPQQVDMNAEVKGNAVTVKFEGELKEWAK